MSGKALFRSYGCFFAEFLGELSLVRLSLLDSTTCVGLRYGPHTFILRSFSWKRAPVNPPRRTAEFPLRLDWWFPDFPMEPSSRHGQKSDYLLTVQRSVTPSERMRVMEY